ncbi:MAG: ABC transporter permease subunit [Actinobacteria bacterium]|nr:ABC transporter permease subunit [Actinomycetota bacterium]
MDAIVETFRWLTDAASWTGPRGVLARSLEHLWISLVPLASAMAVAIPAGVLAGHHRRGQAVGAAISNLGRAVPSLALLVFGLLLSVRVLGLGFSFWPIVFTLFFLALQPLFTNSYTAVREADPALLEAARGQGLSERDVLLAVELPVASPVILTAVRITAVQVVATAPLGALAAGGGLGRFIIDGFGQKDDGQMLGGVVLVAVFALLVEFAITRLERRVVPGPLQGRTDAAAVVATGRAN